MAVLSWLKELIDRFRVNELDNWPWVHVVDGWLYGPGVIRIPAHRSWYYDKMVVDLPVGIVDHYTATEYGTARNMANRRKRRRRKDDRSASWHVTITNMGEIIQMIPLNAGAWHVAGGRVHVGDRAYSVNRSCVGIEHEGWGKEWPLPMVDATVSVHAAIAHWAMIPRDRICLHHSVLAEEAIKAGRIPRSKGRSDPGRLWAREVEPLILERMGWNSSQPVS